MQGAQYRVVSIGTLAAHPLWGERTDVRTGHATTTLVEASGARILVNPGLPPAAMVARLSERSPVQPREITHVFLTGFQPDHRRALELFDTAVWLMHAPECDAAAPVLRDRVEEARASGDEELLEAYLRDQRSLDRIRVAPDRIVEGVDLFPLPGVTPGHCGLLLPLPRLTVLITGDAVATVEHLEQGKVLPGCVDVETAMESFREAVEIADVIVPGRDNIVSNPLRRG